MWVTDKPTGSYETGKDRELIGLRGHLIHGAGTYVFPVYVISEPKP